MNIKQELKSMFTEHWHFLAVNTACKLLLFDKIFEGQNSIDKLIESNSWERKGLLFLLKFLLENKYIIVLENKYYKLTKKGDLLRKQNLNGLYFACLNWSGEHLIAWQNLSYSIKTGKSSFEYIYQKPYFDYLDDNPEKLVEYHKAMYEYAIDDYNELPNKIDFSIHKSIMDVGAGSGIALSLIKDKYKELTCYFFDLVRVTEQFENVNIQIISGDFFNEIPKISDALMLSRVLHDWEAEKAILILENCYVALPDNGFLYIIENCTDRINIDLSLLSLNMLAMCQSFERTSTEYIILCKKVGFTFQKAIQLNQLQTILIFKK